MSCATGSRRHRRVPRGSSRDGDRRLSVIDLAHGWQPLYSRGDRVVAFQNGEIYNYRALRVDLEAQGFTFATHSDTEVLAHGYALWGMDVLLQRVDGMYAIAILDRDGRELHLARDRFGEKPLFYRAAPGRFAYASDLSALAALPWAGDVRSIASRLTAISRCTMYPAIAPFLPARDTSCRASGCSFRSTHQCQSGSGTTVCPVRGRTARTRRGAVAADRGLSLLPLVADVPVGVFLSGGIDSSLVAAIAARESPHINTFSIGFPSAAHDDPHAREVARHIRSNHHEFVFDQTGSWSSCPRSRRRLTSRSVTRRRCRSSGCAARRGSLSPWRSPGKVPTRSSGATATTRARTGRCAARCAGCCEACSSHGGPKGNAGTSIRSRSPRPRAFRCSPTPRCASGSCMRRLRRRTTGIAR